ncbi:MAG: hypothetical protein ABIN89_04575 [Chitinophagaceae bacterium]
MSVLLAYNFKTINHYIKLTDSFADFAQDYDCEEKNAESKKFEDKNDKKDFSEHLPINKTQTFVIVNQLSFDQRAKTFYASSDFSMGVYFPPDPARI